MTDQTVSDLGPDWFWSDYWRTGQQACCFNSGADNYGLEIVKVWTTFFEGLTDGSRILDICTGNGAIALIAADTGLRRGTPFEVHAVDRAEIHVEKTRLFTPRVHGTIKFQSGVSAEALPFADATFDSVVGQFALEYTDVAQSVAEAARVIKPDGRAQFVVHARDGVVIGAAQGQLAAAQFLDEMNILGAIKAFLARAGVVDAAGANASEEEKRAAGEVAAHLQTLMKALDDGHKILDAPVFLGQVKSSLTDVLQKRRAVGVNAAIAKIEELERSIDGHRHRLRALLAAAQDERGARAIAGMFEAKGFQPSTIAPMTIPENNRVYGWRITSHR